METYQIAEIIRKRLNLEDKEWSIIEKNPKFQQLFQNTIKASRYRLVAEVIESIRMSFRACSRSKACFR
jgi:hypothetical protein